ncbi:MAG: nitroreductase family protein [Bacteroidales bacterium]|nr:nitroreductase family protein [Bacteroidales bacterium]
MNFSELITKRQSVRHYADREVELEKIIQCIDAARLAPSASNSQPWTFVVVREEPLRNQVAEACSGPLKTFNRFVNEAPVIVVMVIEKPKAITELGGRIKKKDYPLFDIGIAAEHFCLQAAELGLGTCMLGWFSEKKIQKLLHIPPKKTIGLVITLGHTPPDYPLREKIRKPLEKVLRFERY